MQVGKNDAKAKNEEYLELKSGEKIEVVRNGAYLSNKNKKCMPLAMGKVAENVVEILRVTGCNGVIARRKLAKEYNFTCSMGYVIASNRVLKEAPIAEIKVDTPYYTGVTEAICLRDPLFDLVIAAPINSCLNVVVRSSTPFGLGRNGCWPSRGSQLPRALPFIFSLCCPLNDRSRAAHSIFKIGRLFSLSLFSSPSLARLCLPILLHLLMRGNVYPNLGLIFPCSVWAGNVTLRGKSVQCCTCFKWVHLRRSQLSLCKFRTLGVATLLCPHS